MRGEARRWAHLHDRHDVGDRLGDDQMAAVGEQRHEELIPRLHKDEKEAKGVRRSPRESEGVKGGQRESEGARRSQKAQKESRGNQKESEDIRRSLTCATWMTTEPHMRSDLSRLE